MLDFFVHFKLGFKSYFLLKILVFSNIEDIAREAGSVDIEEEVLYSRLQNLIAFHFIIKSLFPYCCHVAKELQMELQELCMLKPAIYQPLHDMAQVIAVLNNSRSLKYRSLVYQLIICAKYA